MFVISASGKSKSKIRMGGSSYYTSATFWFRFVSSISERTEGTSLHYCLLFLAAAAALVGQVRWRFLHYAPG
jgi:hypothetical protein